jgi:uncharacterized protein YjbJ (UPF0337 family)
MDWDRIQGNWRQVKANVKEKWDKLTDDDLDFIKGKRDRLEDRIHKRYGFTTDYVREEVDAWVRWQVLASPSRTQKSPLSPN